MSALSAPMVRALASANDGGSRRLYRWPGGYWMPHQKEEHKGEYFSLWATTPTVRALISRGMFKEVAHLSRGDPWIVELTDAAMRLIDPSDA